MATTDIPPQWRLRLRQYHRYVTYWRTQADADGEDRSADALPPPLDVDLWRIISSIGPRPDPEAQEEEEEDWPAHWASNPRSWSASCRELRRAMGKCGQATGGDDSGGPSVQQDDGMEAINATTGQEGKCAPPNEAERPERLTASGPSAVAEQDRKSRSHTQHDVNLAQRPDVTSSPSLKRSPFAARVDAIKQSMAAARTAREAILARALTHDTAAKKTWRRSLPLSDHTPARCSDEEDASVHSLEE
ncbi:uncharacterized protein F5Z01DRAFT_343410 [Emericellopsis atlantica]|uniref:Uncharacterized protein n=1 Tax=Emericellopsis atlantica TaxID=2614577 RepID=A0A9P8CL92_9HYPO|nr:uncharacterized protein F5Z01DRAFT_343410 [Emericellopsis atlantica]KAG9250842.1 hypothetical protein F5Z01DRAFT_343410 [Emericellopsis atlantica]